MAAMVMVAATGMVETMVTAAMVETKDMEVATDMVAARVTAVAKAMEETMAATRAMEETMAATKAMVAATEETRAMVAATEETRAMVAATEATRATVVTKGMTRTRATAETKATEEIKDMANSLTAATKDMASSLMAATKDTEGNRAVTTTRATAAGAREGMQRTSTAGKPPGTPHDSSKNWLVSYLITPLDSVLCAVELVSVISDYPA